MNIVQIGCNNGRDHVLSFILSNQNNVENIYLIDASDKSIELAKDTYKNFKNVKFYTMAISDNENVDELELFFPSGDKVSEHISYSKNHVEKHLHPNVDSFLIKASTLNKFLDENQIKSNIYLFIDTEGLDCRIVNTIDFDKFDIKFIRYEISHCAASCNGCYEESISLLNCKNYKISRVVDDIIGEKV